MKGSFSQFAPVLLLVASVAGCSSDSRIVPSKGSRPATSAAQVRIYERPPAKYELLGAVTASRSEGARWDERGNADAGFDSMIAKAASLGANGLLLKADEGQYDRRVAAGYHGKFYQVPVRGKPGASSVVTTQAIYVLEE